MTTKQQKFDRYDIFLIVVAIMHTVFAYVLFRWGCGYPLGRVFTVTALLTAYYTIVVVISMIGRRR